MSKFTRKARKNPAFLSFVAQHRCALRLQNNCDTHYTQCHHLLRPVDGKRGMGMKATDINCIPLCADCHAALHARGDEMAYFQERTGDPEFGKKKNMELRTRFYEINA